MDNNGNFEQQFTQNLKANAPAAQPVQATADSSKLPLIVAIVLGIITLLESIALIISLTNKPTSVSIEEDEDYTEEAIIEDDSTNNNYAYDDDDNLIALNATCVSENGATYTFDTSNNFSYSGEPASNGTYTITDSDLISLSGSNKVLYYNGISVADGLTIYDCEGDTLPETE